MSGKFVSKWKVALEEMVAKRRCQEDGRGRVSDESLDVDTTLDEKLCCGLFGGKDGDGVVIECGGVEGWSRGGGVGGGVDVDEADEEEKVGVVFFEVAIQLVTWVGWLGWGLEF